MYEPTIVIAAAGDKGAPQFIEPGRPFEVHVPQVADGGFYWATPGIAALPDHVGGAPSSPTFPSPGGSLFGVFTFPANSAGAVGTFEAAGLGPQFERDGLDPAFHQTDSIDYEIILSGKVDIELPGGEFRTLRAGDILIMAGVIHAWRNRYDEPCTYAAVIVGAHPVKVEPSAKETAEVL